MTPVATLTVKVEPSAKSVEVAAPVMFARSWTCPEMSRVVPAPRLTDEAVAKASGVLTTSAPPVRLTAPVSESGTASSRTPPPAFSKLPAPLTSPCWKATGPLSAVVVAALSVTCVASSMEAMVPSRPAKPATEPSKTRMPTRRPAVLGTAREAPAATCVAARVSKRP